MYIVTCTLVFVSDYLFQCVDTSESVSTEVYCHPHLCCPLRDTSGCTIALIDLTLSMKTSTLDSQYTRDINKMIKLLTTAFHQTSNSKCTLGDIFNCKIFQMLRKALNII